jgi:hypothetical protein
MWSPCRSRAALAVDGTGTTRSGVSGPAPARAAAAVTATASSDPSGLASRCRPFSLYASSAPRSGPAYSPTAVHAGIPGGGGTGAVG